jgi:hypothetical protein
MIKLFCVDILILSFQTIKFCKFLYMSFCFINIFLDFLFARKMPTKVLFIRKVHNKIQTDKNIEKVQKKQQIQ